MIRPSGDSGFKVWFLQRVTGAFLFVMVLLHFTVMHAYQEGGLTFREATELVANPLWRAWEVGFLVFALYHGLAGVWVVASDYVENALWKSVLYGAVLFAGLLGLTVGLVTLFSIHPLP